VILLLSVLLPVLQLPADASHWIMISLKTLLPLFATIVFYRLVDVLSMYLEHLATKTQSTLDDQLVPLVRKTLKTFVVSIGTLFILQNLDIPIIPLLTGLSIGGLAFALAAQDTIKNFFGSLMIFIDKPFQIGDWITSGEIDGSVEEVGFRSSRVRTFRNSLMYVPNGKLADSTIDNHGMREYRRFYTQIAVTYDTPAELLETFIVGLRKIVENHPDTRKDYYHIYFNEMASFSLNIMFYIFFKVPDWPAELKARHEILMEVMKLGRSLGVHFAFPTQTLHMENFPGKPSLSPEYPEKEKVDQQMAAYFNQTK
jgi:MscS family membrane protein